MRAIIYAACVAAAMTGGVLSAPRAYADEDVAVCPSGYAGVATSVTSCAFADSVRAVWASEGGPSVLNVFSPVTGDTYTMYCNAAHRIYLHASGAIKYAARCVGGNDAVVWIW